MNRLLANRGLLLAAIVVCATGLLGAAGILAKIDSPTPLPAVTKPAATAPAPTVPTAKQAPAQDPRCALQDQDDDAKESKVKKAKPDTDDDELECGDQNDDDREVGEDRDRHHDGHAKPAATKAEPGKQASPIKR
jgi:hypothetical protein